jgi:hypothetical protein
MTDEISLNRRVGLMWVESCLWTGDERDTYDKAKANAEAHTEQTGTRQQ